MKYVDFEHWATGNNWFHLIDLREIKHVWVSPAGNVVIITAMDGEITDATF